jgi:hypothetical protein
MPVIALEIQDVTANSRASVVAGIWNGILNCTGFTSSEGYINRPGYPRNSTYIYWSVVQYLPGPQDARPFFTVQCKPACHETSNEVWSTGARELGGHLYNAVGQRQGPDRTPAYGALAVGRYVKFFRYDYDEGTVMGWYAHASGGPYHVARDCLLVQNALDEIRNNH